MTINSSGPVSLGGTTAGQSIAIELGGTGTNTISLNDTAVRTLAGVPSGTIVMPTNFYGKSNVFAFNISSNQINVDLRTLAVNAGWNQTSRVEATITGGVFIYSNSTSSAALTVSGSFPNGVQLINNGTIVGRGGNGGTATGSGGGGGAGVVNGSGGSASILPGTTAPAGSAGGNTTGGAGGAGVGGQVGAPLNFNNGGNPGTAGGLALLVSTAISITNNGTVGGGGGGGGAGGSGAFYNGTLTIVRGGAGGAGGGLGSSGTQGSVASGFTAPGGAGGAAGAATSGNANITWLVTGNRYGALN